MTREEFKIRALEYLGNKYPELKIKGRERFELETEEGMVLFLEGSYSEFQKLNFEKFEEILDKLINALKLIGKEDFGWEEVKDRIYPQLKLEDQLKPLVGDSNLKNEDKLVFVDFVGEIKCAFGIDFSQSIRYVSQKQLENFGIGVEELKKIAVRNLVKQEEMANKINYTKDENGNKYIFCDAVDGYAAARLLLPDFYQTAANTLGEEFLVAIPERDMLAATEKPNALNLRRMALNVYAKSGHPVYPGLLLATKNGLKQISIVLENDEKN